MKSLTIWQPWASLIVAGAKPYEFRSWRCHRALIGQRIVIHAGKTKIMAIQAGAMLKLLRDYPAGLETKEMCLKREQSMPVLEAFLRHELPMSAGLGTAVIGEPKLGTHIAEEFGVPRANDSDRDEHSNWGWPMLEIEAWDEPVPMRGAQGFWNWPTPEGAGL